MTKETIIAKAYDLLKFSIPFLNKFPRNYKFTLGDRIQALLSNLLELLIEAYYQPPVQKKQTLSKVNITLEKLRYYFRLGYELGLYSSTHFQHFAEQINEIGRICGGWIKTLGKQ